MGRYQLDPAMAPRFVDHKTEPSRQDKVDIWKLEEKETDVNIALGMYRMAVKQATLSPSERIQQMVLVSGDTDMKPALQALQEDFPEITLGVVVPHIEDTRRIAPGSLKKYCHWMRQRITYEELSTHQFPEKVPTGKKPAIKPSYW